MAGLEAFVARGVTLLPPDETDPDEDQMKSSQPLQRADVDILKVLGEALAPQGITLGPEHDGFVKLNANSLPKGVDLYFLRESGIPPYSIAPRSPDAAVVVLHVADLPDDYNAFAHPLGVHVHRLRDVGSMKAELKVVAPKIVAARRIIGKPERAQIPSRPTGYNPALVEEYARTEEDALFEWAVGDIVSRLFESVFRMGGSFSGKPVPDGLAFEVNEAAIYDCKSKAEDDYGFGASDADQQHRYLEILARLERDDGLVGRGVILFTPSADEAAFAAQMKKEFWKRLTDRGRSLRVIPAAALERLHKLCQAEGAAFSTFFDSSRFWRAIWDRDPAGLERQTDVDVVYGAAPTSTNARLLSVADLEVAWLAGLTSPSKLAFAVGKAIAPAAPGEKLAEKARRPAIVQAFFKANGRKQSVSVAGIAEELGITEAAARYLILNAENEDASIAEWGDHGTKNLPRLRKELRGE